jgi:sugar/nucleoside kinase (ribokinase family)
MVKNVLGLGNALLDILIPANNELLQKFDLPKGSMQLVDEPKRNEVLEATKNLDRTLISGGSAANTIHGLACLGVPSGFIGKIGADEYGQIFRSDLQKAGIEPVLLTGVAANGTAVTLITDDSERTFATYLGAAVEQTPEELDANIFARYAVLHIEGYLLFNHALIEKAVQLAHEKGLKISLDCASYNVVDANRDFLLNIIERYVDIVFANEEEARSLTGKEPEEALTIISKLCDVAVVKVGAQGSLIASGNQSVKVGVAPVKRVIDTTGAGDLYASGFLWAYLNGLSLEKCGKAGAITAGRVIEEYGARIAADRWPALLEEIKLAVQ